MKISKTKPNEKPKIGRASKKEMRISETMSKPNKDAKKKKKKKDIKTKKGKSHKPIKRTKHPTKEKELQKTRNENLINPLNTHKRELQSPK